MYITASVFFIDNKVVKTSCQLVFFFFFFSVLFLCVEVESFVRYPIKKVMELIADTTEFKTNCTLVIVDFFVRHGVIGPEEPGYMELVASLRTGGGG